MTTDTSEKGLETLIMRHMTGTDGLAVTPSIVAEPPAPYGGTGYFAGSAKDYDRAHALDVPQLFAFLRATQPEAFKKLALADAGDPKDINRLKFLARLSSEIGKRGVIDVLRKGVDARAGTLRSVLRHAVGGQRQGAGAARPEPLFAHAPARLQHGRDAPRARPGLFINGLPIATFELKNSLTKQTVEDAVQQYKRDRDPRERLFEFGRCVVHFAVDDSEVTMCTELKGKGSWFLPFNKGYNDGAGNPPNPHGLKPDYLWKEVLTPAGLTDILENYAQIVERRMRSTGKKKRSQVFPRYHQLGVVRAGLADVRAHGAGKRYLIQHSAGSGKSNSIAWLAHQLIGLKRDDKEVFDSVIVVTDRRLLDDQIQKTIKQFMQVGATVGHAERLRRPAHVHRAGQEDHRLDGAEVPVHPRRDRHRGRQDLRHRHRRGALEPGRQDLGGDEHRRSATRRQDEDDETDPEDTVNEALEQRMAARKMLTNASYFAFTATPKTQDAGDVRRAVAARCRGQGQAPALPQLHHEAGDRGGLHPRCAQDLHAGEQLLQAGQEDRGRPGVRHQEGAEEAAPLCREPRPRDPAQGRDHGGPFPRAGARRQQDRRAGAGDGGDERHRAGDPVFPRLQGVSRGAQEPVSGDRRVLGRARVRRRPR